MHTRSSTWTATDDAATDEKLLEQIAKMDQRIATAKVHLFDRDNNKYVALGTSKINYIVSQLSGR